MLVLSFELVKQLISTNLFSTDQGKREMRFKEIQVGQSNKQGCYDKVFVAVKKM